MGGFELFANVLLVVSLIGTAALMIKRHNGMALLLLVTTLGSLFVGISGYLSSAGTQGIMFMIIYVIGSFVCLGLVGYAFKATDLVE